MLTPITTTRFSRCGELSFDFFTAALSVSDIIADIAVAVEFYQAERFTLFYLSLAIFCLAQCCYSFLFAATYGGHLSNTRKCCTFLVALPFAQLVPLFTLIESFHLPSISAMLRSVKLEPTSSEKPASDTDGLWQFLQRKYHAHAGFLVEALVEAIPQCALQIAAVVLARESSALNLFSILLSLAVIGSKGWLAAYSLHRPTFVFNSLCIAADVAGCFATSAWMAVWLLDGATIGNTANATLVQQEATTLATEPAALAAASLSSLLLHLALAATICGVLGGGATILFSMMDDHLKVRDPSPLTGISVDSVAFDVYFLRFCAWILSILPSATLLMLLRLSLLPLLAFKSLSSEHATHHAFYTALFAFLREQDSSPDDLPPPEVPAAGAPAANDASTTTVARQPSPSASCSLDERLATVNALITLAHENKDVLTHKLKNLGEHPSTAAKEAVVKRWVNSLGRRRQVIALAQLDGTNSARAEDDEEMAAVMARIAAAEAGEQRRERTQVAVLASWWDFAEPEPPSVEAMSAWQRRLALFAYGLRKRRREVITGLRKRSQVFRILTKPGYVRCGDRPLLLIGLLCLLLILIVAIPAALLILILLPLGGLFPLIQLGLSIAAATQVGAGAAAFDAALILPWTLSGVFAILLLLLLTLLPSVHGFQSLRADVAPTDDLPPAFFLPCVVSEMRQRYHASRRLAADPSNDAWASDMECCICIRPIERHSAAVLEPCGHAFHRECIVTWLRGGRQTCPLCRGRASVEDVVEHTSMQISLEDESAVEATVQVRPPAPAPFLAGMEGPPPAVEMLGIPEELFREGVTVAEIREAFDMVIGDETPDEEVWAEHERLRSATHEEIARMFEGLFPF